MVSLKLRCLCCVKVYLICIIQKERETDVLVWLSRGWKIRENLCASMFVKADMIN